MHHQSAKPLSYSSCLLAGWKYLKEDARHKFLTEIFVTAYI
jgi:hypothetical protein